MIKVIKQSGELEDFDPVKFKSSLAKSGASSEIIEEVLTHIQKELQEGMSTSQIYKHASFLLGKKSKKAWASYSLRKAVQELGPSGFPFEKFIAQILKEKGFEVKTDVILPGHCTEHEIDVVAYNENKLIIVEAKFHNEPSYKTDSKVALYVKARFDDLKGIDFDYGFKRKINESWLITNTKFTDRAIKYGECVGMTMIGWNYPKVGNFQDMIEDSGLHPVTCLETLNHSQKIKILQTGEVLCKKLGQNDEILENIGLNPEEIEEVKKEVSTVCSI